MNDHASFLESGISRRKFVAGATSVVGAGLLASRLSVPRSVFAAGGDTIKIGLVGCGGRGTGAVSQALKSPGNTKLVAMGDVFGDRLYGCVKLLGSAKDVAARVDVPLERQFVGFDAYEKVLAAGIDLVILATPPGFRPLHLAAAVAAGKHVFMEKPAAIDGPGVRKVLAAAELAKRKGLAVASGLQRRHQASYQEAIKRLQDAAIGEIRSLEAIWNAGLIWSKPRSELLKADPKLREMEYQLRNWYYFVWLSGDIIVETLTHNLDICNWLKNGPPASAIGTGERRELKGGDFGEVFDVFEIDYTYSDGTRLHAERKMLPPPSVNRIIETVTGTRGSAELGPNIGKFTVNGMESWRYAGPSPDPYQAEWDVLLASIRAGTPINEGEFAAKTALTAIMGRMAAYEKKKITWSDALESQEVFLPDAYAFDANPPTLPDKFGDYAIPAKGRIEKR